jgi:hypothetical protein
MRPQKLISAFAILSILFFCERNPVTEKDAVNKEYLSVEDELEDLLRIDLLPNFRTNTIVGQISSYDTTGGNNDGFSGMYSFIRKEGNKLILADLKGPGVITRIWTPTPSEDTIEFYFDGKPEPDIKVRFIDLFSGEIYPFINPVVGNEVGGYYCYLPIPFNKSCKIAYLGSTMYFHQIQYRLYNGNSTIESFPGNWSEDEKNMLQKVCDFWNGREPFGETSLKAVYPDYAEKSLTFSLKPGESKKIFRMNNGGRLVSLEIQPADIFSGFKKDLLLEARWDEEMNPAIFSPVADFFGYAYGKPSMQSIILGSKDGIDYCYIPMPFEQKAEINLIYEKRPDADQRPVRITVKTGFSMQKKTTGEGRFYAKWKREINPESGKSYVFLDAKGQGHYIGTILQAQGLRPGITQFFEGDDSTVVDGVLRFHGTGSEDYFNGGWYAMPDRWDRSFSLPLHGCLDYSVPYARTGGYRFYITDKITWQKEIIHTIEHGPIGNRYPVDYTSLALYYSDTPVAEILTPEPGLREVYMPDTLIFHPILMNINLGLDMTAGYSGWGKIKVTGPDGGRIRIDLSELQKGRYHMVISCLHHEKGCDFSVWQRQKKISSKIGTFSDKPEEIINSDAGDILINDFYNSVTLQLEPPVGEKELGIYQLMLIKYHGATD